MVTDEQVKRLLRLPGRGSSLSAAAVQAGMDVKTARKYRRAGRLPSEMTMVHGWRTRQDAFEAVWPELRGILEGSPGLEAKTLFEYLQREYPGRFQDGQLRTLQRRVKTWKALEGPAREVFFPQEHRPGGLAQSDFTDLGKLGVTIAGEAFAHLLYHFVLTYSNWETGAICFSENFESLSEGLQNALWELGWGAADASDGSTHGGGEQPGEKQEFTRRYEALLKHYGLAGQKTRAACPHENGDVEQRHHRLRRAIEQELLLRGSAEFASRREYEAFLAELFRHLNAGRQGRLREELSALRPLPRRRLESFQRVQAKVGPGSTVQVQHNVYSVHSRLIGEEVIVRLYGDRLEVWYAQRMIERMPRQRGQGKACIDYRHVIDCQVRKPGAFENYRYREQLFPSSHFRMAYDALKEQQGPKRADREYLRLLKLAAHEGESRVEDALRYLQNGQEPIGLERVRELVRRASQLPPATEVSIDAIRLSHYDELLNDFGEDWTHERGWNECEEGVAGMLEGVAPGGGSAGL